METRKPTIISDLDYDVLEYILVLVAKSIDGACNLARTLPVCKLFMKLADDEEVLKAVAFDNLAIFDRLKLFQQYKGLLTRCALAGNPAAEYLLAKIMLVSCSDFLGRSLAISSAGQGNLRPFSILSTRLHSFANSSAWRHSFAISSAGQGRFDSVSNGVSVTSSFIAHLGIDRAAGGEDFPRRSIHHQLVRSFLCRCKPDDFFEMYPHMRSYYACLIKHAGHVVFINALCNMYASCYSLKDVEAITSILEGIVYERVEIFEQLQREGMDKNKNDFEIIFRRYWNPDLFRSSLLEFECKQRAFNYGLIRRGSLKELIAVKGEAVTDFESYRARAIYVIDDMFLNSHVKRKNKNKNKNEVLFKSARVCYLDLLLLSGHMMWD